MFQHHNTSGDPSAMPAIAGHAQDDEGLLSFLTVSFQQSVIGSVVGIDEPAGNFVL